MQAGCSAPGANWYVASGAMYTTGTANNVIFHYPFDGDATDTSGNGFDLTLNGTVSY